MCNNIIYNIIYNTVQSEEGTGSGQQGCQVFTTKPAQLLLKTNPIAFRGGSPNKICIPGAKYHVFGVASTRGPEKQTVATVLK